MREHERMHVACTSVCVHMYRFAFQALEPEWTWYVLFYLPKPPHAWPNPDRSITGDQSRHLHVRPEWVSRPLSYDDSVNRVADMGLHIMNAILNTKQVLSPACVLGVFS